MPAVIEPEPFGTTKDGKEIYLIRLTNKNGTVVELINYAAIIKKWAVKDKQGHLTDIVLGYDTLAEYEENKFNFGTTIGRVANRISGARFELDGKEYPLFANRPPNHLHGGGPNAFSKKVWYYHAIGSENKVVFSYLSPDGEEGYPGALDVAIVYSLNDDDELTIEYRATTEEKPTIVNLTNHSYFNLDGNPTIKDHVFFFTANRYLPGDEKTHLVTGEIKAVDGTKWDFRTPKRIGDVRETNFDFDNFLFTDPTDSPNGELRKMASASSPNSGITLTVFGTQPGNQFYTGDFLDGVGKGGKKYGQNSGFCIQTTAFPDAINKPQFPSVVLRPGEVYHHTTKYMAHASK